VVAASKSVASNLAGGCCRQLTSKNQSRFIGSIALVRRVKGRPPMNRDLGELSGLVKGAGILISAVVAIGVTWRGRARWEPSDRDLPKAPQRLAGLLNGVILAIAWVFLASPSHAGLLAVLASVLVSAACMFFIVYFLHVAILTYEVEPETLQPGRPTPVAERIVGGYWLTREANRKRLLKTKPVSPGEYLMEVGQPDKVWPRPARALAKVVLMLGYIGFVVCGTAGLTCAAILFMVGTPLSAPAPPIAGDQSTSLPNQNAVVKTESGKKEALNLASQIDAAEAGTVIDVPAGTFQAHLRISKSLTLKGRGMQNTLLHLKESGPAVVVASAEPVEVRLEDLSISSEYHELAYLDFQKLDAYGVHIMGKARLTLERVQIHGHSRSGLRANGETVVRVQQSKIWGNFDGVLADGSAQIAITGSDISNNYSGGIVTDGNVTLTLSGESELSGNGNRGLYTGGSGSPRTTISNCSIARNGGSGIQMIGNPKVTIANTRITKNAGGGIWMQNSARLELLSCDVSENEWDGIALIDSTYAEIRNNTFAGNKKYGIAYGEGGRYAPQKFPGTVVPPQDKLEAVNVFRDNSKGNILLP